ncbi:hypothetical protein XA68_13081 [Ophiocordyceps unilateralis]|uniref:Uncharacterized protein n=1 Tax=Ophiocordyceps unilateralis TaxID=268505 RepID=A0A2A9PBH9_OPHUN|nr:hypothetical protein XA68_13081 [Ophiocordyceps unilateralis]
MLRLVSVLLLVRHACVIAAGKFITSAAGQRVAVSSWDLQSSSLTGQHPSQLSLPGHDTSRWHHIEASRCTIVACLLISGFYNDSDLWYSDNLSKFNASQFSVPWVYRNEFTLSPQLGQHYLLETNGITSQADIYLNGRQIADTGTQAGSFGGHTYDITGVVAVNNALAVVAHAGDFRYDLIVGFVDWNPSPPDNSTGIWRDIYVKQTGPVSMGPVSVSIDAMTTASATVTVRAKAQNLQDDQIQLLVKSTITDPSGRDKFMSAIIVKLPPNETGLVELSHRISRPKMWWPKQWGQQPLYVSELVFLVDFRVSDASRQSFGIRTVASKRNQYNDTVFLVNDRPFQVLGGGYAPDQFLRWDRERFRTIARYALDMGLNTIRLEGMLEQPELYQIADELGIMMIAGWVCCSKWEAWKHNHALELTPLSKWDERDYETAAVSMAHEAAMLQNHPSVLGFLVGSDSWPDDGAAKVYVNALRSAFWETPIIASAAKRGYPNILGPSGLKMDGPYDWVPPNYWYDTEPSKSRLGAAFGFGSELGSGVGTPEYRSLTKFLSPEDLEHLWQRPETKLFHMSTDKSSFANRTIYNKALFQRYGRPQSLKEYLLKSQMMDYEATRAQTEAYASRWNAQRPATGSIYWMLNSAWPSLHWNLFDYVMHPAGAYFGAKTAGRLQHVAYDAANRSLWVINRSLDQHGQRTVALELMDLNGTIIHMENVGLYSRPNTAVLVANVSGVEQVNRVALLRLLLYDDEQGTTLSRNVYWISQETDVLDWDHSTWFYTPVSKFADFQALSNMETAQLSVEVVSVRVDEEEERRTLFKLENHSPVPAFFIRLNLVNEESNEDVKPVIWSDNYVTLWPNERITLEVDRSLAGCRLEISGGNTECSEMNLQRHRKMK